MLTLSIEHANGQLQAVELNHFPCTIGRGDAADLVLSGWRVARVHARLERGDSGYRLIDCGSLAGTWVNGERIAEFGPLGEADEIAIGSYRLRCMTSTGGRDRKGPVRQSGSVSEIASAPDMIAATDPAAAESMQGWRRLIHRKLLIAIEKRQKDLVQLSDAQLRSETAQMLEEVLAAEPAIPETLDRAILAREVLEEAVGLGPIERLLEDDTVSEIMVNGTAPIHVERAGLIEQTSVAFTSDESIRSVIERIVSPLGRHIDESSPMVDARLPDGSRINAVIPPLSLVGPVLTIRRFNRKCFAPEDLIRLGTASLAMFEFLGLAVRSRLNIVVSGGTGSGKTSLLNVLAGYIGAQERVITIEDAAELRLAHRNLVNLESRPANTEGRGQVSIRDLVRNALRMRPDRIVVGECRGGEALDMLQAMNTGHDGSLTTVHANGTRDALSRIEVMTLMAGVDMPVQAIREQIASAVQIVVQQARLPDGSRRIVEIAEVTGMEGSRILMQPLFRLSGPSRSGSPADHAFEATGNLPQCFERKGLEQPDPTLFRSSCDRKFSSVPVRMGNLS
jgi:pilus assembly protein CpaF